MTIKISSDNIQEGTLAALGSSVPKISAITYPGNDTAADIAGGQTITITGTGFNAGANILINGAYVPVVNVVNSTSIEFTAPVLSAGTYTLYVINTDGGTAISIPGISYSGTPTWTTAAGSLASVYETSSISSNVAATGDATVTYSLFSGTLPTSSTLNANTGLISGTAPASNGATTYSFVIRATDGQQQDTDRSFSITINTDVVTWISPANNTTTQAYVDASTLLSLSANAGSGQSITYSANSLPAGLSISGNTITGTPTTAQTINSLVTATSSVTNKTSSLILNWTVSVAGDTYFKNTTALLSGDTFINTTDSSTNNFAVTPVAAPTATNLTPFNDRYSGYFNGSSYLSITDTATTGPLSFGTGDFTIEFNFFNIGNGTNAGVMCSAILTSPYWTSATDAWQISFSSGSTIAFSRLNATISPAVTIPAGVWTHVAYVRQGTSVTCYINGTSVSNTAISAGQALLCDGGFGIGRHDIRTNMNLSGNLHDLRIVKGTAVYTANFTPSTTPLTAISGTSLLILQNNRIKDNSTNAFAITNTSVSVSQKIPFETTPSVTLGSTSFSGSNYLTTPASSANDFGTGDFTIEMWINPTQAPLSTPTPSTNQMFYGYRTGTDSALQIYWNYTQGISVGGDLTNWIVSSVGLQLKVWSHIAVVRSGTTMKLYINGVSVGTATNSTNLNNSANVRYIGGMNGTNLYGTFGYISNLRIVKGTAVYTVAFTPPTSPLTAISGTSLLTLQSPVPNNNNIFVDSGPNNLAITNTGTPTQGSFSPFGSNWSNYFNGTTAYLSTPATSNYNLSTGDWTVECWVYVTSNGNNTILTSGAGGSSTWNSWQINNDRSLMWQTNPAGNWSWTNTYTSAVSVIQNNAWTHIAAVRYGSNFSMYVNGVSVYSTNSFSGAGAGGTLFIGTYYANYNSDGSYFRGNISNLRIVKGTALYTAAFTPSTTPLTAIANTSLLTCQSNNFKDNSTNNFVVTKNGDTTVSRFSPFGTTTGYVPSIHGGSMYINGHRLSLPTSNAFNLSGGNWTIELYMYVNALPAGPCRFLMFNVNDTPASYTVTLSSNGIIGAGPAWPGTGIATSAGTITTGQWYHVALSCVAGSARIFINGTSAAGPTSITLPSDNDLPLYIGYDTVNTVHYQYNGYISDLRITKTGLYSSNFTPNTTPLNVLKTTALLLRGTNASIVDQSMQSNYTTVADSKVSSAAVKYGTGAMYFDGTGDYLITPSNQNVSWGTGDFTIESWIKWSSLGSDSGIMFGYGVGWTLYILPANKLQWGTITPQTPANLLTGTTSLSTNQWYHIAVTRQSGTVKLWVNGVLDGSVADARNYSASGSLEVGISHVGNYFTGYIDDLRITKGVARYTSTFTPPAQALYTK